MRYTAVYEKKYIVKVVNVLNTKMVCLFSVEMLTDFQVNLFIFCCCCFKENRSNVSGRLALSPSKL